MIDATSYLHTYQMNAKELARAMIKDVYDTTGITATAGIGDNLYPVSYTHLDVYKRQFVYRFTAQNVFDCHPFVRLVRTFEIAGTVGHAVCVVQSSGDDRGVGIARKAAHDRFDAGRPAADFMQMS